MILADAFCANTAKISQGSREVRGSDFRNITFIGLPYDWNHRLLTVTSVGMPVLRWSIGCPRIIRTCIFPQLSVLRWNHWRCGYQNFLKYSSKGKAKCHTPPKSPHDPVQSLFPVSAEDLFSLCDQVPNRQLLIRGAFPDSTIERLTSYLLEGLQINCETSWISVALNFSSSWSGQRRKVASSASPEDTENHARSLTPRRLLR